MGINLRQHEPHLVRSHLHCVRSCYRCWSPCGQWSVATWASSCPFSPPLCQVMLQVLESVWAVIRGNMSLIVSVLTSTVSGHVTGVGVRVGSDPWQHEPHRVRSHLHCVRSCYRCWSPCGQWSVATWASSCPFSPPLSPLCSAVAQPFSTLSCLRWVDWHLVAEHYETDISLMNMMTKCTWFSHQAAVNHFVSESVWYPA